MILRGGRRVRTDIGAGATTVLTSPPPLFGTVTKATTAPPVSASKLLAAAGLKLPAPAPTAPKTTASQLISVAKPPATAPAAPAPSPAAAKTGAQLVALLTGAAPAPAAKPANPLSTVVTGSGSTVKPPATPAPSSGSIVQKLLGTSYTPSYAPGTPVTQQRPIASGSGLFAGTRSEGSPMATAMAQELANKPASGGIMQTLFGASAPAASPSSGGGLMSTLLGGSGSTVDFSPYAATGGGGGGGGGGGVDVSEGVVAKLRPFIEAIAGQQPQQRNWLPWIAGGGAALLLLYLLMRRGRRRPLGT